MAWLSGSFSRQAGEGWDEGGRPRDAPHPGPLPRAGEGEGGSLRRPRCEALLQFLALIGPELDVELERVLRVGRRGRQVRERVRIQLGERLLVGRAVGNVACVLGLRV